MTGVIRPNETQTAERPQGTINRLALLRSNIPCVPHSCAVVVRNIAYCLTLVHWVDDVALCYGHVVFIHEAARARVL